MKRAYFVTGTDTDAGKTTVAAGLLHAARQAGYSTAAVKPVASGCIRTPEGLRNSDATDLWAECSLPLGYEDVNPFAFEPAIAPHVAAREAGVELPVEGVAARIGAVLGAGAGFTLVEGAGGWRVPLNGDAMLSALPLRLGLPVILVVGVRLGCINHALLTAEVIRADGLTLSGWVANLIDPDMSRRDETLASLDTHLNAPCLGRVPWLATASAEAVARHLDLSLLA